jgi:geranylgeranylglycerol-phosphate geranylgeranyltransferase
MVYSSWGKKTGFLGNLMVSSCISLPFLYGGVLTSYNHFELIFSLLAFLTNTGREITKGIVDFEGDEEAKIMTIAVTHGPSQAAIVASLFYSSAVILSVIPIYLDLVSIWYLPFVLLTDLGLIWGTYTLLNNPSRENSRKVKKNILYFMLSGILGFAAGSLL